MASTELKEAERRLKAHGGYEWALSGRQAWSAADVAEQLTSMGIATSKDTVIRWFKQSMPHVQDFGGLGMYVSRADLVLYLAARFLRSASSDGEVVRDATS
ncbi:MAG TPA: hypothetical protein VFN11_14310 [Ktedonobacterales bacterium]|nr:hypothetical protein [Ktedonobacterales bacterium]